MNHKFGTLYVCPTINTMGPVVDARHNDLLPTWQDIDRSVERIFAPEYRNHYLDSFGRPARFSWFVISWSGFISNPVQRDFGYFNIYDHYTQAYGSRMREYGDDIFWMYNHPPASGVGNEWGMDWMQNAQYLEILMRAVAERNWFPSVIQVPTEAQDTSHFLENYFPFDLSNRNAADIQWEAKNADGKTMAQVIDWRRAPHNWDIYRPNEEDYQVSGGMKRHVGRLLDIQLIVYVLTEAEIEAAFRRCLEGHDVMLSAYEHDFRDRADAIRNRLLEPVHRLSAKYPEVKWRYENSLDAFRAVSKQEDSGQPTFEVSLDGHGNLLIQSPQRIFGYAPFTFFAKNGCYQHINPLRVGERAWLIYRGQFEDRGDLFIAAHSNTANCDIHKFDIPAILRNQPVV